MANGIRIEILLGVLIAAFLLVFADANNLCQPYVLFDDGLAPGVTLQGSTSRASCQIVYDPHAPQGNKVLSFKTDSWLSNGDNCALLFPRSTDLSSYTEIEFWLRANYPGAFVSPSMEDSSNHVVGFGMPVNSCKWRRYRFPLPKSFNGLDFHNVLSAFLLQLQLNVGDEIRVDYIRLLCRDYFPILSYDTEPGREVIEPGGSQCRICNPSSPYLRVSPSTWACYLFFRDPSINLCEYCAIQFALKTYEDVQIIIQSGNNHYSVNVPSTCGKWEQITIPLSDFHIPDLTNVIAPFSIQRASSENPPKALLVSDIIYLRCDDNNDDAPIDV